MRAKSVIGKMKMAKSMGMEKGSHMVKLDRKGVDKTKSISTGSKKFFTKAAGKKF
jgi:hypothetical protein